MDTYYANIVDNIVSRKNLFSLEKKIAVIIGGTKGLGLAMALGLAGAGATVVLCSRNISEVSRTQIEEMFKIISGNFELVQVDAVIEEDVKNLFKKVDKRYGSIDILINSQGSVHLAPTIDFPVEKWQEVMDNNVKSVFLSCKHVAPYMIAQGFGKIINVSSVRGFQGRTQDPAYAPSKGAVNQLTRSLAIEWATSGIHVNGLAPVFTKTKISEDFLKDETKLNWVLGRIPQKRLGELEDIVGPAIFLSSSASNFINGHILSVDGGWLSN